MATPKQTTFEVFRVSADGSLDCHRMNWPAGAQIEKLKVTVPEESDPAWVASQLRRLADQFETTMSGELSK